MPRVFQIPVILLACLLGHDSASAAIAPRRTDDIYKKIVEKKRLEITKELEQLGKHDWAGCYQIAGPHAVLTIWITPNSAVHTFFGCFGLSDQNYGTVSFKDDRLRIDWQLDTSDKLDFLREFLIVKWDERRYLVPTAELFQFANDYHENREEAPERLQWTNYLRNGGEKLPVQGDPLLPGGFAKYMTMPHLRGHITKLGSIKEVARFEFDGKLNIYYRQPITLSVGSQQGVIEQMRFNTASARNVVVTKVEENQSEAIAEFSTIEGTTRIPLEVKDVVTTKR